MKKVIIVVAVLFAVIAVFSFSPAFAADFQSLVCKWESAVPGEGWKASFQGREVMGDLYIKIRKVEGNSAYGEMYIDGRASYHRQWLKFVATLSEIEDGITLDFKISTFISVHLEARGDKMTGIGVANTSAAFFIKKAASCGD